MNFNPSFLQQPAQPESDDCLFVGGPLHDEVRTVDNSVDVIFLAQNGQLISGAPPYLTPDYTRHDSSNVFAHRSATPEEVEQHISLVDEEEDETPPFNDSVLDYVKGARDMCETLLKRFACPQCQPQYLN